VASRNSKGSKLKLPRANPVFEKWIEEMRNDAIDRELKSKQNFTKVFCFCLYF
jgi:hypothetical protein